MLPSKCSWKEPVHYGDQSDYTTAPANHMSASTLPSRSVTGERAEGPELQPGLVEALTSAYATLLKRQRTASAAFVRWTASHSRSHEFAWFDAGLEKLFMTASNVVITSESAIYKSVQKMLATIELNPYEREIQYGYPYVIGQLEGTVIRAPLLTIPISITADGPELVISVAADVARFNSLPFRSETDSAAHELSLARLVDQAPDLPLTPTTLRTFCETVQREIGVLVKARLDGILADAPVQPRAATQLTIVDNAACFIAATSGYFLVSDLENIGRTGSVGVSKAALGWAIGKRSSEPTNDTFEDRRGVFYPYSSNPSQRRVAHLIDDPRTRILVVQGPPGTGKSLTLANLACHLVATGKRVLITSQKDKALQVVDELLRNLGLAQLPMTLLRQDRESKQQLKERLQQIQKDRSAEETQRELERAIHSHTGIVEDHDELFNLLRVTLSAEHEVHRSELAVASATGLSKLLARVSLFRTVRRAERHAHLRSDQLGEELTSVRQRLQSEAASLLAKAAENRTSTATKNERNQLREFSKLLGRNQANYKNYPVFDRLKGEPDRCAMLLKILPCWIMTPDDVARLFPCNPGVFDVVIIDEASQCDLPSMTPVLFRAKQAVIVGDSKQMQAQRFAFTSNQVSAQAWAEQGLERFDPDRWLDPAKIDLLQLASIRTDEEVFLDEHYRSLPPIIGFSNERWYGGRLRIMRDAEDKRVGDVDSSSVRLVQVPGVVKEGTQENEQEARRLVSELHMMLRNPTYSDATFGVICLFEEQMHLINDLVADSIPEELRLAHNLVVVNPDGFQGDERDVILYSLSYDGVGMSQAQLSARQADREHIQGMLNVAFTRARDELHIFHSTDIREFAMSSGSGAIRDWLEYCALQCKQAPGDSRTLDYQSRKAQSDFEMQVMTALVSRGIVVKSQVPSCGYFIDIVAESEEARVALECDGELWHLDEHGALKSEDLVRQEVLERAGWNVIRIPYRGWRENPERHVHHILSALSQGAAPESQEASPEMTQSSTPDAVSVDRFEYAVVSALKAGARIREDVFKAAREQMGYSRLGPQIRKTLDSAIARLEEKRIVCIEENEVFFSGDEFRTVNYQVRFAPAPRDSHRHWRRYRRRRRW